MGTALCWWVSRGVPAAVLRARAERLVDYYRALGAGDVSLRTVGEATIGVIALRGEEGQRSPARAGDDLLVFGRAPEAWRSDARAVLGAGDAEFARWEDFGALVACDGERLRVLTSGAELAMLHRCGEVLATHAVAAAVLATGRAGFDPDGLPELLRLGFVGGARTLVAGVETVEPATVIDLARTAEERSLRPLAARYAPVPEAEAPAAARAALAAAARELRGRPGLRLGLTDGLDSLVVALALQQQGVAFSTFTWGEGGFGEPRAAARAATLGLTHEALGYGLAGEEAAGFSRLDAQARWTEGTARLSARGAPAWPGGAETILTGAGGESGRAFFYRWLAANHPDPSPELLARTLAGGDERVRSAARGWVAEALAAGHTGWRALDVVYARQRLRRWGRSTLPCAQATLVAPLAASGVQRALISLPLADRLSDGFGRAAVASVRPDLVPPAPPAPRAGVPPVLRRMAARARELRPARPVPAPFTAYWEGRPRERAWLVEEVLADPALTAQLGERWVRETREGLLAGRDAALLQATAAAGPVAFGRTLRELASA